MTTIPETRLAMKVDEYVDYLRAFDWFANVGKTIPAELSSDLIDRVSSWEDAIKWSQQQISFWCRIEAGNLLMNELRVNAPDRFLKWNDVAKSNLPFVKNLLEENILPRVPEKYREPARLFVQSQLIGVLSEVAFSDCLTIVLLRNQFRMYEKGFFPCGWSVGSPELFPGKATIIVY